MTLSNSTWKQIKSRLHTVIFEANTPKGKLFDVSLIFLIILSVFAVMLNSVKPINITYGNLLYFTEWVFTIIFTIEYILRLVSVGKPMKYARSFFGIIDLVAFLPTYLSVFIPGSEMFLVVRVLRVLRIFRILKILPYITEAQMLKRALVASRRKIFVFLLAVLLIVIIMGSMMYVIEGEENGFTSIPRSIYWSIVTLTTVGYGDISPQTPFGQILASIIMIFGYGLIAVPTGIVTVEIARNKSNTFNTQACPQCSAEGHDSDAKFCKLCGADLYHT
ncbi:ion transporter [Candidatus Neomarinimicrobiota bacterium]